MKLSSKAFSQVASMSLLHPQRHGKLRIIPGKCRLGLYSSIKKLARAARRGMLPEINVRNPEKYLNSKQRMQQS